MLPDIPARLSNAIDRLLRRNMPPEAAPILLGMRRIYVLPTMMGVFFAASLGIMLLTALNYNLSIGFGMIFLLTGATVASLFHAFHNLFHLSINPGRVQSVFAGQDATFHLLLDNTKCIARPALCIKAHDKSHAVNLAANSIADIELICPTSCRGWLPLGRVIVETRYPLGLIRAWSFIVPDSVCLVYPAPEEDPPPLPDTQGDNIGTRIGGSGEEEFAQLRNYHPSDSPRHIAWKVLARGGAMMTKQFSGLGSGNRVLDWHTSLPAQLDTEARISRLTAWVLAASLEEQRFALHLPHVQIPSGVGPAHLHTCLKQLALFDQKTHG